MGSSWPHRPHLTATESSRRKIWKSFRVTRKNMASRYISHRYGSTSQTSTSRSRERSVATDSIGVGMSTQLRENQAFYSSSSRSSMPRSRCGSRARSRSGTPPGRPLGMTNAYCLVLVGLFLYWKKCGCCSFCCCSCLKPRGTSQCGACSTCPYVIQGPVLRKQKRLCCQACQDPRQMKFINFRGTCQSDCVVFCIHCDR